MNFNSFHWRLLLALNDLNAVFRGFSTYERVIRRESTGYLLCMVMGKFKRYNTSVGNTFHQQFEFPITLGICFEANMCVIVGILTWFLFLLR